MPGIGFIRPAGGGGAGGSVYVTAYSDAGFTTPITSADIGDTIYIKAVPLSIAPVEYLFVFEDINGNLFNIYQGANDNTSWVLEGALGNGQLFCFGTEDASSPESWVGQSKDFELAGFEGILQAYPNNNVWAGSQIALRYDFTDPLVRYRRASDNDAGDFSRDETVTPVRITGNSILSNGAPSSNDGDALSTFVSGTNAFVPTLYDQTTNNNDAFMSTQIQQPQSASTGSLIEFSSLPALLFNFSNSNKLNLWTSGAVPPFVYQTLGTSITLLAKVRPTAFNSGVAGAWFGENVIIELQSIASGHVPISAGFDSAGRIKVGVSDNGISSYDAFFSTFTCSTNTDYEIAVTIDNNEIKIYINGSLDSTHTIVNATSDRTIGATASEGNIFGRVNNNVLTFNGYGYSMVLKSEVLNASDILNIYNNNLL